MQVGKIIPFPKHKESAEVALERVRGIKERNEKQGYDALGKPLKKEKKNKEQQ